MMQQLATAVKSSAHTRLRVCIACTGDLQTAGNRTDDDMCWCSDGMNRLFDLKAVRCTVSVVKSGTGRDAMCPAMSHKFLRTCRALRSGEVTHPYRLPV